MRRRYTALPYWPENRQIDSAPAEFDLYGFNYRQPFYMFRMANMDQDPIRRDYSSKYMPDDNAILVNAKTAADKGIVEGDVITVESLFGTTKGRAHLTETVRPDSVGIGGARGRKTLSLIHIFIVAIFFRELDKGMYRYDYPYEMKFREKLAILFEGLALIHI